MSDIHAMAVTGAILLLNKNELVRHIGGIWLATAFLGMFLGIVGNLLR